MRFVGGVLFVYLKFLGCLLETPRFSRHVMESGHVTEHSKTLPRNVLHLSDFVAAEGCGSVPDILCGFPNM